MLELDSLGAVEAALRDSGFFEGDEGLVADLYLGYGLSEPLRRSGTPPPPEPCRLPLAAVQIRDFATHPRRPTHARSARIAGVRARRECDTDCCKVSEAPARGRCSIGEWKRSWSDAEYAQAIEAVQDAIARGDVYQVNLVQHLSAPFRGDPSALADRLVPLRPLHGRPLTGDGWAIVSASPELFLARRGRRVWTMPIKGTRPRGEDGLRDSEKDAAEHVMIVDLERNDLSRVCEPGSVRWPELMTAEPLAGVEHLVSRVEGTLREDVTLTELLEAVFPGGSVTGAPKISALDHIAALEPVGRGASMGALGVVYPNGDLDLALTIRTFAVVEGRIHLWVGGGIVWDSEPEAEIEESWVKARPLLEAIGAPLREPALR